MNALSTLLAQSAHEPAHRVESRRQWWRLAWPLAVVVSLLGAWCSNAPLAGAVVATAQLKVEHKRKTVQHQEGGIVREILVHDGQSVRAGEALLVIGDLRQEADLKVLQDQRRAASLRVARADAESRLAARFDIPDKLRDDLAALDAIAHERAVFAAHRLSLDEQTALLKDQSRQAQAQATALSSQLAATADSRRLSQEELAINEGLAAQGFVHRARLITLQKSAADAQGKLGEVGGDLAAARQRVAELQSRMAQLRLAYQNQAGDESREAAARVRELDERLRPSADQVERQTVRAPVDGEVMSLAVAAPGAVVTPRQALLEVVPRHERVVVEARIDPQQADQVRVGGAAEVRLITSDARHMPLLPAIVSFLSPDRVSANPAAGETGKAGFDVTVEIDAQALPRLLPGLRLQAGMPAELYVTTGSRTLFEYLAEPLRSFSLRAMREPG